MRFVIVTGMSGAGKSTALNYLEDVDYYCVDNLPVQLVKDFAQIALDGSSSEFTKFAVGIDIRSILKNAPSTRRTSDQINKNAAQKDGPQDNKNTAQNDGPQDNKNAAQKDGPQDNKNTAQNDGQQDNKDAAMIPDSPVTQGLMSVLEDLDAAGIQYEILFLDASDEVLLKRYKETRRTHPLSGKTSYVDVGIAKEREYLAKIKARANYILDTSKLLTRELKSEIVRVFVEDRQYTNLYVTVQSFGFKYGIPADSDLVIDVRFLPNPYYDENLRTLTGNDKPIVDFVMSYPQSTEFVERYVELMQFLIPHYVAEGKNQLVVSVGCTGGRHRSVCLANEICRRLAGGDYGVRVEHRDIDKDPVRKGWDAT